MRCDNVRELTPRELGLTLRDYDVLVLTNQIRDATGRSFKASKEEAERRIRNQSRWDLFHTEPQ